MRCVSCGLSISEIYHQTEQGNVCNRCWNDPNLFFPEKIGTSKQISFIREIIGSNSTENIELPVFKLKQKEIPLYTGKIKARDLLKLYAIFGFDEENLDGYQREMYEDQVNEISYYIKNSIVAMMPGLLISVREKLNFHLDGAIEDFGILTLPLRKGALWIIDGQHRVGGFEKLLTTFGMMNEEDTKELQGLFNYEIPVTFIDTYNAIRRINNKQKSTLNPIDIERVAFFIINKTQRRLSPSLKDTLQYVISRVGINGIPAIEKDVWRTEAVAIGIDFNSDIDSPFYQKINISGQRGLERPIQLNSFVSSLRPLLKNTQFTQLNTQQKKKLLHIYWSKIKENNKDAFKHETYRNYLLLKTIGIYTLNLMLVDYITASHYNGLDFMDKGLINYYVNSFKGFDWKKQESTLAGFGGMKGVREAREILIEYINGK